MNKIFISGSISIKHLPPCVKDSVRKIISQNMEILVGDADGIDSIVQNFCKSHGYNNITVYSIYTEPRYIVAGFKSRFILPATESKRERERQLEKDKAMTMDSDFSLIVWDGKSKGSYRNALRATENGKKVKLYLESEDRFLDQDKINEMELEFIFRKNNGYTAAEVVAYLISEGEDFFKNTREFNKCLIENKIIKKEDDCYKPCKGYEHLFFIEKYRGKDKGVKFKNEFVNWIERWIKDNKQPEQQDLF